MKFLTIIIMTLIPLICAADLETDVTKIEQYLLDNNVNNIIYTTNPIKIILIPPVTLTTMEVCEYGDSLETPIEYVATYDVEKSVYVIANCAVPSPFN